jgi:hypothetical protein
VYTNNNIENNVLFKLQQRKKQTNNKKIGTNKQENKQSAPNVRVDDPDRYTFAATFDLDLDFKCGVTTGPLTPTYQ